MPAELDMAGLATFLAGLEEAVEGGIDRGANYIADVERQLVPVDEGDLKDTIRVEDGEAPTQRRVLAGDPSATKLDGRPVDYAPHVEYGTIDSAAQPFIGPAVQAIDVSVEVAKEIKALAQRSRT